jgi:hypothetical protein
MSAHDKSLIPFTPAELRARHDGWTAEKQIAFIEALAETACVEEACRRVGMSDSAAYQLRRRPCGAQFRRRGMRRSITACTGSSRRPCRAR